jgi:hypothetical protein
VTLILSCVCFSIALYWVWKNTAKKTLKAKTAIVLSAVQCGSCIVFSAVHIACNGPCPLFWFGYFVASRLASAVACILSDIFFDVCSKDLSHKGDFRTTRMRKRMVFINWLWVSCCLFITFVCSIVYFNDPTT